LAFGTRTVVSNFVNGMVLMVEQPVHIGDYIEMEDEMLRVIDTGALQTKVISHDNVECLIPNSVLYEQIIHNYSSAENGIVRIRASLNIEADTNLALIDKLVGQSLKKVTHLITDRSNKFVVLKLVDNCYHGEVHIWINMKKGPGRKTTRDQFYRAILPLLHKHQVKLADSRKRGSLD
ncbi:MAG: mechanosensitive ion channel domain-containing protein, partial [Pseudomonadota bacterium]